MALTLSSIATQEKNKLNTDGVWLIMLKITIPGVVTPIRVVRNNENVDWNGNTYIAFPFEINEINETAMGEVPRVDVRVSNVSGAMEAYLQDYDTYTKNNGFSPVEVVVRVVNSNYLAGSSAEVEHIFELKQPKSNREWVTFTLGASNPFNRRFPQHKCYKNNCRFIFKSTLCGYAGGESDCNKTLTRCRELVNSDRFGGFPGIGIGGVILV